VCPGDSSEGCFFAVGYPGGGKTVVAAEGAEFILKEDAFSIVLKLFPETFFLIGLPAFLQTVPS
jgi:hypothetical protein